VAATYWTICAGKRLAPFGHCGIKLLLARPDRHAVYGEVVVDFLAD
jgi:hypothetical protein